MRMTAQGRTEAVSELLPVLYENTPQMSACSYCAKPGHCCQRFYLYVNSQPLTFWKDSWQADAEQWIKEVDLPFRPDGVSGEYRVPISSPVQPGDGREYVTLVFGCPHLTDQGRCGIYDARPSVCRMFSPGESPLCILGAL